MTTVVLGWDGLDYDLLDRYGMHDEFGAATSKIDTLVNPELEKPHTWELWPSIITGLEPEQHGIHADEYIETGWSNPLLRVAARLSDPVPDAIRWRVGRWLRGSGASLAFESEDYYEKRGLSTIFDGRQAFPVAIPNYRSHVDERFDVTSDRGAELGQYMAVETGADGETVRTPSVTPDTFLGRISADAAEKIGLVRHALDTRQDIIFVWIAFVDTAGHIAPTVGESDDWMRRAYEIAADYTGFVRNQLGDDDTLICLSDHGLQEGEHTESACIGTWPPDVAREVDSVVDVARALDAVTPRTGASVGEFETDDSEAAAVRERLENLGYVG